MVGLGMLPGSTRSEALAVSGDGSAIVGFSGDAAFIWDPINGMRDLKTVLETSIGLELTGIDLEKATGISDDGRVVAGIASHLNGGEAWIAVLNECGTDADCSDGLFCNGVETCVNNECIPGADACLPSDPCDEEQNLCLSSIPTVSHWGLIGMGLLLVSAATCVLRQRMGAVMPESRS